MHLKNISYYKSMLWQALFPRVCPVCGKILQLPHGWQEILLRPKFAGVPLKKDLRKYEALLLCPDCSRKVHYVAAPFCRRCGRPLDPMSGELCEKCRKTPGFFDRGRALLVHDEAAKKILYDLKFRNKRDNADWVGFSLAVHFAVHIKDFAPDAFLPVPLHKKRMFDRGYNQAQLIAEACAFWLQKLYDIRIPVDATYLLREERTKPQRTLHADARRRNVRRAFAVAEPARYRRVVLIDDIFTSGATVNACAHALKEAGCGQVFFLAASIVPH